MSAVERNSLTGLTLDAILGNNNNNNQRTNQTSFSPPRHANRTLSDVIRDEDPSFGHKDRPHPTSMMMSRRNSVRLSANADGDTTSSKFKPQMSRRSSTRFGDDLPASVETPAVRDEVHPSFKPQVSRRRSLAEEKSGMSAREAIAAQEASEAAHAAHGKQEDDEEEDEEEEEEFGEVGDDEEEEEEEQEEEEDGDGGMGGGMSLMDLLEETDRQMGFEGAKYVVGEEDEEQQAYYDDDEDDDTATTTTRKGTEQACCICMVRHKGAASSSCGHTYCRLCSRELMVQRGNCPLCNSFILEILEIF